MTLGPKIVDMSIERADGAWRLYVPIRTGHTRVTVPFDLDRDLSQFLETAFNSPRRRFGENTTHEE